MAETKLEEKETKKDFKPIVLYFLIQFIVAIIVGGVANVFTANNNSEISNDMVTTIGNIISFSFIFIIFISLYFKKIKYDAKKLTRKNVLFVIIVAILMFVFNLIVTSVFMNLGVSMDNQDSVNTMISNSQIIMSFLVAVAIPFIEEMVFRYSLSTIIKNKVVFVIVSSILFGVIHGIGIATVLYVVLGAIISIVYLKTDKNVIASSIVHIINNLLSLL